MAAPTVVDPTRTKETARRQRAVQTNSDSARAKSSRRLVLLVNPKSGGGSFPRGGVGDGARGVEVVVVGNRQALAETARGLAAAAVDALGVAGGDGSLAGAGGEAVSMTPTRFTIRPRGPSFPHFVAPSWNLPIAVGRL